MEIILDTNIIVDIFRGKINAELVNLSNKTFFISIISVGELYFGAENSSNPKKHIEQIDLFLQTISIIYIDYETSKNYSKIKAKLKKLGIPIPENDIWIAAITIQNNFLLVSDDKHFENIDGLNLKETL
jgi:tRNA(fMet)-specific endonuclease VapC